MSDRSNWKLFSICRTSRCGLSRAVTLPRTLPNRWRLTGGERLFIYIPPPPGDGAWKRGPCLPAHTVSEQQAPVVFAPPPLTSIHFCASRQAGSGWWFASSSARGGALERVLHAAGLAICEGRRFGQDRRRSVSDRWRESQASFLQMSLVFGPLSSSCCSSPPFTSPRADRVCLAALVRGSSPAQACDADSEKELLAIAAVKHKPGAKNIDPCPTSCGRLKLRSSLETATLPRISGRVNAQRGIRGGGWTMDEVRGCRCPQMSLLPLLNQL